MLGSIIQLKNSQILVIYKILSFSENKHILGYTSAKGN